MSRSISDRLGRRQGIPRLTALVLVIAGGMLACGDGGSTGPEAGRLALTISGLPPGVPASVTISGPDGFQFITGSSRTLAALDPGSYTITATDVTSGGSRYAPSPPTQTVLVTSGALANAAPITYTIASARLSLAV